MRGFFFVARTLVNEGSPTSVDTSATKPEDKKMRKTLIGLLLALTVATTAEAAVSVSIGINIPSYPRLVAVPGSAVYYAPSVNANYFFYDGLYWVFNGDQWLSSTWYNGPWRAVGPDFVPVYLWQVPVRYYRRPPAYFHAWGRDGAPRWGEHWGREWQDHHAGWDRRDGHVRYSAAPLPSYQRQYSGNRYPKAEQQAQLHSQNYRYEPREQAAREHYQEQGIQHAEHGQGHGEGNHGNNGKHGNER
jgi:hypothetical protein